MKHSLIKPRSTDEVSGGLVDQIRRISQIERRLPVESAMCTVLVVVREVLGTLRLGSLGCLDDGPNPPGRFNEVSQGRFYFRPGSGLQAAVGVDPQAV